MKILQVIHSVDPAGGGPIEATLQAANILCELGHTVEIASLDSPYASCTSLARLKVYALGPAFLKYGYSNRFVPWLIKHAREYDAVIVRGIWQYSSFGVWRALRKSEIPYFVFVHGMLDPWFKRTYPLKHLKKWLYWPWAEYRVLRDAKAVLFTCEQERLLAHESFRLYKCNETIVNYGTAAPGGNPDTQREIFFKEFPELRGKRIFLFLGRIHPKKGCDLLVEAFSRISVKEPSLHLVMAGPDQIGRRAELQKKAKGLGIDKKITWTGMLSGDLKWGAFYAAEAFVLPSHQENFGMAAVEALACGIPVLISNKVNIWREIEADGAGLVANDDLQGTIELFEKWLGLSYNRGENMKQKAKQCFLKRFEIHKAAQSLIDALRANGAGG